MSCPVCGAQAKRLFSKCGYPIYECVACQHRFATVQLGSHQSRCGHAKQAAVNTNHSEVVATCAAEAEMLQRYGWHYAELFKAYMPPGTVLDVSAAAGFMLKGILERGWYGVGLEANCQLADYGRTQLGLSMVTSSLENLVVHPVKKPAFDLILMIQSIAHFQDLHQALHNAATLTRPNGFWFIETWDRTSWPAQLWGRYWHEYNPPTMRHWFSPAGVAQLAEQYGLVEVARGRPQKWLSGARMKAQLQDSLRALPAHQMLQAPLALIPDGIKVPQPSFDQFWVLLQKRTKPRLYSIPTTSTPVAYQQAVMPFN